MLPCSLPKGAPCLALSDTQTQTLQSNSPSRFTHSSHHHPFPCVPTIKLNKTNPMAHRRTSSLVLPTIVVRLQCRGWCCRTTGSTARKRGSEQPTSKSPRYQRMALARCLLSQQSVKQTRHTISHTSSDYTSRSTCNIPAAVNSVAC